ncbi:MAG: hypothetical protein EXR99_08275 [Gemmataceae bacterium]|nr:hypothetical protein [Gemmataceae bacterium]
MRIAAMEIIRHLGRQGIPTWVQTRGILSSEEKAAFVQCGEKVSLIVPVSTLDADCARLYECLAPAPEARLSQVRTMLQLGVEVQVEFGPLIPGVNDSGKSIQFALEKIARAGVKSISIHCLALPPEELADEIARRKGRGLQDLKPWSQGVTRPVSGFGKMRMLSTGMRGRIMGKAMLLARKVGLQAKVNGILNPDFLVGESGEPPVDCSSLKERFLAMVASEKSKSGFHGGMHRPLV